MEEITKQMPLNSIITNEEDTKSMKIVTDDTFLEVKKEIGESYERITITKSTKPKSIEERRIDVKDLRDKGETQEEIADILKVSQGTVSRDEKKIEEEKKNTN
jgi:DNA-binding NarL/FixJ family response regulator